MTLEHRGAIAWERSLGRRGIDRRILVLATGMFAIGTDSFVTAGLLVNIARDLGVTVAGAGQLVTAYALSYAISTPIMAAFLTRWPRARILKVGLLIFMIGNLVTGLSTNFFVAILGRGISGVGAAIFAPTASATATTLVVPDKSARALAMMMAALSLATAFGAPLGTLVGTFTSWRMTLISVAAIAGCTIWCVHFLGHVSSPSASLTLGERLAPLRNQQVLFSLLTTFLVLTGLYVTYTYMGIVFDRVTRDDGTTLALFLSIWGIAGTFGTIVSGRLMERFGERAVINAILITLAANFALLPWTSANLGGSVVALLVWGLCGWGFTVPQQHRLIGMAPRLAPILLSLYAMAVYAGASASGVIGALAIGFVGGHQLPFVGAALISCGLIVAELSRAAGETSNLNFPKVVH